MKEFTGPGGAVVAADDNVVAALFENARTSPSRPALAYRQGAQFVDVSTVEFAATVRELAAGLIGLGLEPGSRVALFMPSRIEFAYLDYAILAAGCATVTIYETSSADQVEWIVGNSEAAVLICADDKLKAVFDEVAERLPACQHVFVADSGGLDALRAAGAAVSAEQVDARVAAIRHDDLATLVYTSGTTGRPKGCMLTHGNFIWDVRQVIVAADELMGPGSATLCFLPLAHILARVVLVAGVTRGVHIAFSTGVPQLVEEMQLFGPTYVVSVPRVFEKIFNTAHGQATGVKGKIFERAVDVAIRASKEQAAGKVSRMTQAEHKVLDALVYRKLRHAFGGKLQFAVSGGAPLGERLGHFFRGVGVLILEGYGLTETTAAATLNTPERLNIGSVGQAIPGASVRIADDGEILLKGGHIFAGYWKNPEATAQVLDADGWFSTGDIGELDDKGFLRITGRKKELIVTAGGKNVAPAVLEDRVRANALVSQCLVFGDNRPFIGALVTIDPEELPKWAAKRNASATTVADLANPDRDALHAEVQVAIDDANAAVSKAESIRTFRVLDEDFTVDSGELTPTMKVRREVVLKNYAELVDEVYGGTAGTG